MPGACGAYRQTRVRKRMLRSGAAACESLPAPFRLSLVHSPDAVCTRLTPECAKENPAYTGADACSTASLHKLTLAAR